MSELPIAGDGGPIVLAREDHLRVWSDQDYDYACSVVGGKVLRTNTGDMLVLDDSSWGVWILTVHGYDLGMLQVYGTDKGRVELFEELVLDQIPEETSSLEVEGDLCLAVAACPFDGGYPHRKLSLRSGLYRVEVFSSDEGIAYCLKRQ